MDFSHTPTFLRSAMLEDPFCLGDLLGPEDVLRIHAEYPDLFSNNSKSSIPWKPTKENTGGAAARFERLSQPKVLCNRPHHLHRLNLSEQNKTFSKPKSFLLVKKDVKVQESLPPVAQSQSAPDQSLVKSTVSKASKSQPLLLPSNTRAPKDMKVVSAKAKTTRINRLPVKSHTSDFIPQRFHSVTSVRSRLFVEKKSAKLPPVEKRYTTSASGVLKPIPSPVTAKKIELSSRSTLLTELTKLRKLDALRKHSNAFSATGAPRKVEQATKKRGVLEELDKIVFQLPETSKCPSFRKIEDTKANDLSDDSATSSRPSTNETQTLTQDFIRMRTPGVASAVSTEETEEQLTKESMNRSVIFHVI